MIVENGLEYRIGEKKIEWEKKISDFVRQQDKLSRRWLGGGKARLIE